MNTLTIDILEFCAQEGIEVEADLPVLKGVKVLGGASKNRRRYTPEAVDQGAHLYEGLPVNIDHPEKGAAASRGLRERFGKLVHVRHESGSLRGDLHYNPKHPLAEAVRWWADNQPGAIGLSHNATGTGRTQADGTFIVDRIVSVRSVDLVADPATTQGLYEAVMTHEAQRSDENRRRREEAGPISDEERAALLALRDSTDPNVQVLLESVERHEQHRQRLTQVRELIERAKLPAVAVTEVFLDQVARAESEAAMRNLIEDRKLLFERASVRQPRSFAASSAPLTAKEFAQALKQ